MARCPAGMCPFDPFQLNFGRILRSKARRINAYARREDKGSMRKDRPSWQRMKLCVLRCDIHDSDLMILAAPAFTSLYCACFILRALLISTLLTLLICMVCSWTARMPLKGRRHVRRSFKTPLKVEPLTLTRMDAQKFLAFRQRCRLAESHMCGMWEVMA